MAYPTTKGKDPDAKQESLSVAIKAITKTWDSIKNDSDSYKILIQQEYFRKNPGRMDLFHVQKYEEKLTDEVIAKRLQKHSTVVINCMEALVEFINGNEETKPILFVLGKQHKMLNVNEKMFMEMKEAICKGGPFLSGICPHQCDSMFAQSQAVVQHINLHSNMITLLQVKI
ncbi:hypothetical protein RUM43_003156 [Polyplax serrata]|uniref:C2H2-type domain-containing protein n=1 Tax=Polyplax serrata TaxID=468196 RepID=A0AAN8NUU5_POLSC